VEDRCFLDEPDWPDHHRDCSFSLLADNSIPSITSPTGSRLSQLIQQLAQRCRRSRYTMMEASSPLAAMQAPTAFMGHCRFKDPAPTYASYAAARNLGPNNFNFRDMSMKKSQPDYFSLHPVRGSSPTASLAADLSQNFHIDQRYKSASHQSNACAYTFTVLSYPHREDLSFRKTCSQGMDAVCSLKRTKTLC